MGHDEAVSLAFLKRKGYADEREWRAILHMADPAVEWCHLPIELDWVQRVILSPWMSMQLKDTVRAVIRALPGCATLRIDGSTLTSNRKWKAAGERLLHESEDGD